MPIDVLGFDHVDLTVTHLERSRAFYSRVLGELGFGPAPDPGDGFVLHNGLTSIGLHAATQPGAVDRSRPGLHHLALRAAARADVDAYHDFLCRHDVRILDPPAEYPQYGKDYYAVFFSDPDEIKLELVHFPWGYWAPAMTDGRDPRPRYPRGRKRA